MQVNGVTKFFVNAFAPKATRQSSGKTQAQGDKIEISNTARVYDKIDNFLNMNAPNRLVLSDLSDAEKEEFYKMLNALIQKGIVGYEYLDVNGKKEKHYIVNEIGDERIYGARPWEDRNYFKPKPRR
jgi:hypothetical protein